MLDKKPTVILQFTIIEHFKKMPTSDSHVSDPGLEMVRF